MLRMRSNDPRAATTAPGSLVARWLVAPRAIASAALASVREIVVTWAPSAAAIFTPMCPRPPTPTTATLTPGPAPQRFSGE